jgi:hypothetical protein
MERYLMDKISIKPSWEIYLSNDEIAHNTALHPTKNRDAVFVG